MPDESLQYIISQCLKGKSKYQKKLYEMFYPFTIAIALRYSKCQEDAEEISIDTFIKVFHSLKGYHPQKPFKSWLSVITIHTAIDYQRKHYKIQYDSLDDQTFRENRNLQINENSLSFKFQLENMIQILQQLPTSYQTVFNLYEIEGYSHEEIAKKLGISTSTSRSTLTRAKKQLKILLSKYHS